MVALVTRGGDQWWIDEWLRSMISEWLSWVSDRMVSGCGSEWLGGSVVDGGS